MIQAVAIICQSERLGVGLASQGLASQSIDGGKGCGNCFHLSAARNVIGHLEFVFEKK